MEQVKSTIYINSKQRNAGENINDWTLDLSSLKYRNVSSIQVKRVDMDRTFYDINNNNNQLYFEDFGTTARTVTVTNGHYSTITLLAAQIESDMDSSASGDTFTVTADVPTGKINILDDAGVFELTTTTTTNAIWDFLGYNTSADKTGATNYDTDNNTCLKYTRYIDIVSPQINSIVDGSYSNKNNQRAVYSNILYRVYVDDTDFGKSFNESNNDKDIIKLSHNLQISKIQLQLKDEFGNFLEPNGKNYGLKLELGHDDNSQRKTNQLVEPVRGGRKNRRAHPNLR